MSTINHTQADRPGGNLTHIWAGLAASDDGQRAEHTGSGDRTVQVAGTFGGASAALEGSLDGANWFTLRDTQGNTLVFTTPGLRSVLENAPYMRPKITGGDGSTSITAILNVRR